MGIDMDIQILIIVFIVITGIINIIRVIINIKNKEYMILLYPEDVREKWIKVYEKPHIFFIRTSLFRILLITILLITLLKMVDYNTLQYIGFGMMYYYAFISIFEEMRALIGQAVVIKKVKAKEIVETNYSEILKSQLIVLPIYICIGLIPLLFILQKMDFFNLGCLFSGLLIIFAFVSKIMKTRSKSRKATASSKAVEK
jgi:hypothetical protein